MTNENDENAGTTRLTRAKAAAFTGSTDIVVSEDVIKKPLHTKKSASRLSGGNAVQPRKRAALGDVSNVTKHDAGDAREGKKSLSSKTGLVSKAAQPSKIQKPSRANSTRSILGVKDKNTAADLKRPTSGSGVNGNVTKKRNTSATASRTVAADSHAVENVAPPVQKSTVTVEIERTVKITKNLLSVDDNAAESQAKAVPEPKLVPVESKELPKDLDLEDIDDPAMVAEYVQEIFEYLKELELTTMANPEYMNSQTELEWRMRGILVDWLLEVHTRFRLLPETLFLAVNIIDRFLSCKIVQLDRLQLVGVTAMFIASKYEEVLSPHVQHFRNVADDGFTEEEILTAERFILAALNYDLSYPNPMNFLRRISKADNYDIETRTIGKYLLEISCLDHRFLGHPPSQVAAAAMYLARLVLDKGDWVSMIPCAMRPKLTSLECNYRSLLRIHGRGDPAGVQAHG